LQKYVRMTHLLDRMRSVAQWRAERHIILPKREPRPSVSP
jgi:hypothetical protein